jgi:ectoine hydroxylase-related dioxygenase (phytanoyl-CoA dioxygenase family)
MIKKLSLSFLFFAKRFVGLFPKKYNDQIVRNIVASLEKNSYYHYENFYSKVEVEEMKRVLEKIESQSIKDGKFVHKNLTNKKTRTNVLNCGSDKIRSYTNNELILDVAEKFHGIKCKVEKASYEVKQQGENPETSELKDRKDDTVFYHFDRPFKVLKTFLVLEDIEDKDGPFQIVKGSHKLTYKSPFRKFFKYFAKIWLGPHHYLLDLDDEKDLINQDDVIYCKGKAGDLFFVNTEAWHTGRRLGDDGKRVMLWNYIYGDHLSTWVKHLAKFKFLRS